MNLIQLLLAAIPAEKLAGITSEIIGEGRRRAPVDLSGSVPLVDSCGVRLNLLFRVQGHVDISHEEIATGLGTTKEAVDGLTAVQVARESPFVGPTLGKVQAVLSDAEGYAAAWPERPWEGAAVVAAGMPATPVQAARAAPA
jgi:hypothetical protein